MRKDGFSTVYKARLLEDRSHRYDICESLSFVTLKTINLKEFVNHIEKYLTLSVYGLTLNPEINEYMIDGFSTVYKARLLDDRSYYYYDNDIHESLSFVTFKPINLNEFVNHIEKHLTLSVYMG
ncbi:1551_t:CDS:2 [Dentiscutata erythropus]|uniref:1551_t:CDS:1 n=1 Tax=Dentiscutata erythropus TaxID=1348616 RepID=A0A9N9EYT2_9GLOM|nr:1551_t:CDS:2 [Dentiscutata erythropus]